MAPHKIRRETIARLRRAFLEMTSPRWDLALEGKPASEVTKAARTLLALQRARLRLVNTELAEIRDHLKANEAALERAGSDLDRALGNLNRVERVLEAAGGFLKIVGRVVGLAA
jgi:hypothetical protein